VSSVVATSMVTNVGMSAAVAIVTSAATMETSYCPTAESASTAAVKSSSATMTTMLGKSSVWQPAKRANADDCEKNSQESRFHHFRTSSRLMVSGYRRFAMRDTVTLDRKLALPTPGGPQNQIESDTAIEGTETVIGTQRLLKIPPRSLAAFRADQTPDGSLCK